MKHNLLLALFAVNLIMVALSCSKTPKYDEPTAEVEKLQKQFSSWWAYHYNTINLSGNFIALDNSSNTISKESFLKELTTGAYIPVKLKSKDTSHYYKLYRLTQTADPGISTTIKNTAAVDYAYFQMEGKPFPDFIFQDLAGNTYTKESLKGKTVVLKCWFIACAPCVAEIPELNTLVEQYKQDKDMVFISLATDSSGALTKFLAKRPFHYAVVANQNKFMSDSLHVSQYPTHFIINKQGLITKVVSRYPHLRVALEKGRNYTQ